MKAFLKRNPWAKKVLLGFMILATPLWVLFALMGVVVVFVFTLLYETIDEWLR